MEISAAPLKYRNILKKHGGPIERLEVARAVSSAGEPCYRAGAFLNPPLRGAWRRNWRLYDDSDGCGTHALRSQACYIAASEAIERWAFYSQCDGPEKTRFGFDIQPSTMGMAAFPGLTRTPARRRARLEAVERWSVIEWWLGRLPARSSAQSGEAEGLLEIRTPFEGCSVVVLWRRCSFGGLAFGFAAGTGVKPAAAHAQAELDRNITVLERYFASGPEGSGAAAAGGFSVANERRLVFFAGKAGEALFRERAAESGRADRVAKTPRKIVDAEIPGPWTRYATVWRVLFEQSSYAHLDPARNDIFLF